MRADVSSVVQDLLGDLLDAGIVVLRRVWNGLKFEFEKKKKNNKKKRSRFRSFKKQHSHVSGSCHGG